MSQFGRNEQGGVMVEVGVMIPIIFLFVLGSVDFLFAFYQWNAAAKAVEAGARIAAVSTPVANGLRALSTVIVSTPSLPGATPMPDFTVTCDGASSSSGTCSCTGTCTGVAGYNPTPMNWIVFGRGNSSCTAATSVYGAGMCNFLRGVAPANVRVEYKQTGLGYAGRPNSPVPSITVSFQSTMTFRFFFLGALRGFSNIPIPASATVTGEDLLSSGS